MAAPVDPALEERIVQMRNNGAPEDVLAQYRRDWVVEKDIPDPNDPLSFSRTSDLNTEPDFDATNPIKALGALMSGAIKGVGGIPALAIYTNEKISSIPFRVYQSSDIKGVFQGETPTADFVNKGLDEVSEATKALTGADTDSSLGLRYLESAGGNVASGAVMVKGMTKWGNRLMRSLPAETNALQRLAIEAAKNPKKMQAFEAMINTSAAVSGQTVYEVMQANGATPTEAGWWRLAAEIGTGFSASTSQRLVSRLRDLASSKLALTPRARERRAEKMVGDFFNDVMSLDPRAAEKYVAARKLEDIYKRYTGDETGLNLTTAQSVRSSPVTAADRMVNTSKPRTAIEAEEHMRKQAEKTRDFIDAVRKKGPDQNITEWQEDMRLATQKQIDDLQAEIDEAVAGAEKEAITLTESGDPVALGNLGRQKLETLVEEMDSRVDAMYSTVEDVEIGVSSTKSAWTKAMASPLQGDEGGRLGSYLRDLYDNNFKNVSKSSIAKLRQFQKYVRVEMREMNPNSDTYRRLAILDDGIQSEFTRAASKGYETDLGRAAQHLEIANNLNKKVSTMFNRGEMRRLLAEDFQGINTVAPEDFFNRFIRSNNQTDRFVVAKEYAEAFGSPNVPGVSRELIKQAFLVKIRGIAIDPATKTINTARVASWLEKHDDSIRELGLTGEFDNVGSVARQAAEIKATNTLEIKNIEKSILAQAIEEDPKVYVRKALESGKLSKIVRDVTLSAQAKNGFRQAAWEVMLESTTEGATKVGSGNTATLILDPTKFGALLETNEKSLRKLLGDGHYDDLKVVQEMMETVKPVYSPKFSGPMESLVGSLAEDKKIRRGVISKLVAISRGFISKEFGVASAVNEFSDMLNNKSMAGVFEKALRDPKMAQTLASIAKDKKEVHALRSIYSAAIAPLADIDHENDPTAELRAQFD